MVLLHRTPYVIWCLHSWWGKDNSSQLIYHQMIGEFYFIIIFLGLIYPQKNHNPIHTSIFHLPSFPGIPPEYIVYLPSFPGRPPGYHRRQWRHHNIHYYFFRLCVLHHPIHNPIRDLIRKIIKTWAWLCRRFKPVPLRHHHVENHIDSRPRTLFHTW